MPPKKNASATRAEDKCPLCLGVVAHDVPIPSTALGRRALDEACWLASDAWELEQLAAAGQPIPLALATRIRERLRQADGLTNVEDKVFFVMKRVHSLSRRWLAGAKSVERAHPDVRARYQTFERRRIERDIERFIEDVESHLRPVDRRRLTKDLLATVKAWPNTRGGPGGWRSRFVALLLLVGVETTTKNVARLRGQLALRG